MNAYVTDRIRNVGIVGHGDTGKTQLVSSLLFTAGMTPRLGKVAEGTTITDWDEEEIARKITIHTGVAHAEWRPASQSDKIKINFLDTPGYSTFINDTKASLVAADAALVLVDAAAGVQVVTEKVWSFADEYSLPRAIVLNWMDRDLADFDRAMESLQNAFGRGVVALQMPIGRERGFRGVVDLISMKAYFYEQDGNGVAKVEEIPQALADDAKLAHEALVELVAEGNDELMQEFFDEGTLPVVDLVKGLREAVAQRRIFPVLLSSALHNITEFRRGNSAVAMRTRQVLVPQKRGSLGRCVRTRSVEHGTARGVRIQNAGRSVLRAYLVFQGDVRRFEERCDADQFSSQFAGTIPAPARLARKERRGNSRAACRRHRLHREAEGNPHGRDARR
ncbi:MAG: GTP-binding protein [Candidatus Acidiferrales bacterium]